MRMFFLFIIIFLQLLTLELAYSQEANVICWEQDIQLNWKDFQGKQPTPSSNAKAGCAAVIRATGFWDNELPNYRVTNCFDKNISWAVDTTSYQLLKHENLHFNIAEIYARRIRRSVDSLRNEGIDDISTYLNSINYNLNQRNKIDSLFDKETAHGIYITKQDLWEKKIMDELETLSDYSESKIE